MDGVERIRATLSAGYEQNHPFRVQRQADRGSHHGKSGNEKSSEEEGTGHEDRVELHEEVLATEASALHPADVSPQDGPEPFHLDIAV